MKKRDGDKKWKEIGLRASATVFRVAQDDSVYHS